MESPECVHWNPETLLLLHSCLCRLTQKHNDSSAGASSHVAGLQRSRMLIVCFSRMFSEGRVLQLQIAMHLPSGDVLTSGSRCESCSVGSTNI